MAAEKRATGRARVAKKAAAPRARAASGSVRASVATYVEGLDLADDARRLALAQLALTLAASLDDDAGMATAAVSKELRATLLELDGDDDGDDDGFAEFEADLGVPS